MSRSGGREIYADVQTPLNSSGRFIRYVFAAALFVLPLLLIFLFAVPATSVFSENLPRSLRDKCIRLVLVVACFFAAAFASNAIRFSKGRVGLFTAGFVLLFLVHLIFSLWGGVYPDIHHRFGRGAPMLQYLWMLGSMFYGMVTWSIVQRKVGPRKESLDDARAQFTIGSILVWVTLTALMIALLRSWAFTFFLEAGADPNASIDVVACALFCATLPLTIWLMRTRWFLFVASGCWIICFAACWIVFALIGLHDSGYDWRDGYVSTIVAFALTSAMSLLWFRAIRVILNYQADHVRKNNPSRLISRLAISGFTILSVSLWGFVVFWAIANFGTFSKDRSFAAFDSSPLIMQQLEEAYGAEAMERVRDRYDPQATHEWLNHLSRDRVPKKKDINYQLAKLTKLEFVDSPEQEGLYRKTMGFSEEEVTGLSDETLNTWICANRLDPKKNKGRLPFFGTVSFYLSNLPNDEFEWHMSYAPWDRSSMPLADKFCVEKQPLIHKIRELIKSCDSRTFPVFEHGIFVIDDIPKFAAEMLFVDTRHAIARDELPRVFENLECISKLAALESPQKAWLFLNERLKARAMEILLHLLEVKQLAKADVMRITQIAAELNLPVRHSKISRARRFASLMLEHRANLDSKNSENLLIPDRELESRLVAVFPQTVHWPSYVEAQKERFEYYSSAEDELEANLSKNAQLYRSAYWSADLQQPFHRHALDIFETPGARAKRLGALEAGLEQHRLNLLVAFAIRAKLRRVALKLLLHRIETGSFPESLQELDSNTDDPFTGKSLIYRIVGERFELYSAGENSLDDYGATDDFPFKWPARTMEEYFKNN